MSDLDFDIDHYTDDELYQLVDLTPDSSKEVINYTTNELIQKYVGENKPLYYNFFMAVQNKLLGILEAPDDESDGGGEFIKTEYQPGDKDKNNDLVDRKDNAKVVDANNDHFVLRRQRLAVGQGTSIPFVQGQMNPTLRNVKKQLINVDSHYRRMIECKTTHPIDPLNTHAYNCNGVVCPSDAKVFLAESSTDFTFNLSQPVKHALKMYVYSYEIPHSWYVFSHDYGTASFGVSGECIDISAGNYTPTALIEEISGALFNVFPTSPLITISLNPATNKVTIKRDSSDPFDLKFYDPSGQIYDCSRAPCRSQGAKLDYNLGWLLGFRQPFYTDASGYTGEALIDTYGFRYLFIELDDFNRNRLNQGIISLDAHRDTFSYSAAKRCSLPAASAEARPFLDGSGSCGKPPPPWQGPPLTANQTYTRAQLVNAQQQGYSNRYLSPVNSDIIARIPVKKFNHYDILFDNWNSGLKDTAREYFGPVTLKRMRVRLLNDKGYVVNLNNMDFSFSLMVEHLYQY
jgi:hypothetical protein